MLSVKDTVSLLGSARTRHQKASIAIKRTCFRRPTYSAVSLSALWHRSGSALAEFEGLNPATYVGFNSPTAIKIKFKCELERLWAVARGPERPVRIHAEERGREVPAQTVGLEGEARTRQYG